MLSEVSIQNIIVSRLITLQARNKRENEMSAKLFFAMKNFIIDTGGQQAYQKLVRDNCGTFAGISVTKISDAMSAIVDTDALNVTLVLGKSFDFAKNLPQNVVDNIMHRRPLKQAHDIVSHDQIQGPIQEQLNSFSEGLIAEVVMTEMTEAKLVKIEYMCGRLMESARFLPSLKEVFANGGGYYGHTWKALAKVLKEINNAAKKTRKAQDQS